MSEVAVLILLYAAGVLVLLAEIFIPSYGLLSVVGVGFLIAAVSKTFTVGGREAGIVAVFACLVFLPVFAVAAIKIWPRTPIGRRIAPPNPTLTSADTSVPVAELSALIGLAGRSVSVLRPVGICDFNGRRVPCVAQFGFIEAGCGVEGVGITGSNLAVVEQKV